MVSCLRYTGVKWHKVCETKQPISGDIFGSLCEIEPSTSQIAKNLRLNWLWPQRASLYYYPVKEILQQMSPKNILLCLQIICHSSIIREVPSSSGTLISKLDAS